GCILLGYEASWLVGGDVNIHDDHDRSPSVGHMGRSSGCGGFDPIVECVFSFRPSLAMVRNPAARQEYLFAVLGLDCPGRCRDCGSGRLRIAVGGSRPLARVRTLLITGERLL